MPLVPAFALSAMVFRSHLLPRPFPRLSWPGREKYIFPDEPFAVSRFPEFRGSRYRISHLNLNACSNNKISRSSPRTNNEVNDNLLDLSFETLLSVIRLAYQAVCSNFLPSVLISAVLFGLALPEPGRLANQVGLSDWATFGVFLLSGLALRTGELGEALEAWPSLFFGLVSVLFMTPLVATIILQVKLVPQELVTGLAIFCCVPTTLSSGVALTQIAGANKALALSLTVLSNIFGIFTMPFVVSKLVALGIGISIPTGVLMKSLVKALLVPLLLGKVLRDHAHGVKDFVDKRQMQCSMLSALCLSIVPWIQASRARESLLQLRVLTLALAVTLGMFMHLILLGWHVLGMLILNHMTKQKESQRRPTAWAVILTASQKTLPIAVVIIGRIGNLLGEPGLLLLPCVAAHITQIIIDSFLVKIWVQGALQNLHVADQ